MNLLFLIMQLIVMRKNVRSGMTSARSNSPDKLANMNDSVWCQLMQRHPELAQNIHNDRVRRHVETNNKEIFEYHRFIFPGIRNRLYTRQLAISFQKIVIDTLKKGKSGLQKS
jgi:hypothetical protein